MIKIKSLLIIILVYPILIHGQTVNKSIDLIRGKKADFIFRSMYDIQNGKTLSSGSGYTSLKIYYDTVGFVLPTVNGWELCAYTLSSDLQSDFGSPNLNLNKIVMYVTVDNNGTGSTKELTDNVTNVIASGSLNDAPWWNVQINYDCAKQVGDIGLLNVPSDYYRTEIFLFLRSY